MPKKRRKKPNRKKRVRKIFKYNDFKAILDLPERLAKYLRLWLHLDEATWNLALDKIRQHKDLQDGDEKFPGIAYKEWSKSKGRGKGRRYFAAPCDELKLIQKAILQRILYSIPPHFCRFGNQIGSSILANANHHLGARYVFSVDIINAFPSVYRSRIKANLKKPIYFMLRQFAGVVFTDEDKEKILDSLVDLVCLHDRLPQGPPTSPRILDLVCLKMDKDLFELLEANSTPFQVYKLSAYVDDITVSSSDEIPEALRNRILETIRNNGFIPHTRPDKTRYYSPQTGAVPVITGLVLTPDGRITMAPRKVNQLRARLHGLLSVEKWSPERRGRAAGNFGFIRQVYPEGKPVPSKLRKLVSELEKRLSPEEKEKALKKAEKKLSRIERANTRKAKSRPKRAASRGKGKGKSGGTASDLVQDTSPF